MYTLACLWLASETPQTQGPVPDCRRSWLRSPRRMVPGAWDAHPQQGHSQQQGQCLPQCVLSQSPAPGVALGPPGFPNGHSPPLRQGAPLARQGVLGEGNGGRVPERGNETSAVGGQAWDINSTVSSLTEDSTASGSTGGGAPGECCLAAPPDWPPRPPPPPVRVTPEGSAQDAGVTFVRLLAAVPMSTHRHKSCRVQTQNPLLYSAPGSGAGLAWREARVRRDRSAGQVSGSARGA